MSAARLSRDSVTLTGYLVLGTWGWFLYGFGALLPGLGEEQGISRTLTSLHSVALALGGLIAGLAAVPLIRRFRRRGTLLLGGAVVTVGSVLLAAGGAWTALTLAGALVAGTGGSLLINTISPAISDHHGVQGAAALAEGNAVAAGTGLVAPLVVGAGIAAGLTWRPAVLLVVPFVLVSVVLLRRHPAGVPALDAVLPPRAARREPVPKAVVAAVLLVMLCVGVEFVMAAWSADLLRQRTGVSSGGAAAGVSAVIGGMMVGRLAVGKLALHAPPRRLLAGAIVLTVIGWAVAWSATALPLALAGLALTGLGIAAHYPLGASLVFDAAGTERDRASGVMSVGIAVAAGGGPFALGALADASSTHAAFLVVPVLMALALAMLLGTVAAGRRGLSARP